MTKLCDGCELAKRAAEMSGAPARDLCMTVRPLETSRVSRVACLEQRQLFYNEALLLAWTCRCKLYAAVRQVEMDEAEKREQTINFAFGQMALTRDYRDASPEKLRELRAMCEEVYDERERRK